MLNYISHVDTDIHTHGCSALSGFSSPAELLNWGYWGRPEGLGSFLTALTPAVANPEVLNAFLLANSEATSPLQITFQRSQISTEPKGTGTHQNQLGGPQQHHREADEAGRHPWDSRGFCGSDSSTRSRFSQGSQSHGLSNKGNGIRSTKCLCEEQNCAKRLKTEPRHAADFVTGAGAR